MPGFSAGNPRPGAGTASTLAFFPAIKRILLETVEYLLLADPELTFFRWARLRDFSEMGLALRPPDINAFINEGYLERTETAVVLTEKGKEALQREPAV